MKAIVKFISVLVLGACATHASARDSVEDFLIADAMSSTDAKNILGEHIKFYFGDQAHPKVVKDITTSSYLRKTNGANKSDKDAYRQLLLPREIHIQTWPKQNHRP